MFIFINVLFCESFGKVVATFPAILGACRERQKLATKAEIQLFNDYYNRAITGYTKRFLAICRQPGRILARQFVG